MDNKDFKKSLAQSVLHEIKYEKKWNENSWDRECAISHARISIGRVFENGKKTDKYEVRLVLSGTKTTENAPRAITLSNKQLSKKLDVFGSGVNDSKNLSLIFNN